MGIHPLIEQDREYITALRRWFHSHPELSMKEYNTAARIEGEPAAASRVVPHYGNVLPARSVRRQRLLCHVIC